MNAPRTMTRTRQVRTNTHVNLRMRTTFANAIHVRLEPRIVERIHMIEFQPERIRQEAVGRPKIRNRDDRIAETPNLVLRRHGTLQPGKRLTGSPIVDQRELRSLDVVKINNTPAIARFNAV